MLSISGLCLLGLASSDSGEKWVNTLLYGVPNNEHETIHTTLDVQGIWAHYHQNCLFFVRLLIKTKLHNEARKSFHVHEFGKMIQIWPSWSFEVGGNHIDIAGQYLWYTYTKIIHKIFWVHIVYQPTLYNIGGQSYTLNDDLFLKSCDFLRTTIYLVDALSKYTKIVI